MTSEEQHVLDTLAAAYNAFNKLPVLHGFDKHEFTHGIHVCMNIVLAREGLRVTGVYRPDVTDDYIQEID